MVGGGESDRYFVLDGDFLVYMAFIFYLTSSYPKIGFDFGDARLNYLGMVGLYCCFLFFKS